MIRNAAIKVVCVVLRHPTVRHRHGLGWKEHCPCGHIDFTDLPFRPPQDREAPPNT
jgi:hypothetical protein